MKGEAIMLVSQVNTSNHSSLATANSSSTPQPVSQSSAPPSAPVELPSKAVQATSSAQHDAQVKEAVANVNKVVQSMTNDIAFTVDQETGIKVVTVMDVNTKEIIRQFPSEEVVDIAKALDRLQGLIIRQKA
jgi:flagellar protein FlaG